MGRGKKGGGGGGGGGERQRIEALKLRQQEALAAVHAARAELGQTAEATARSRRELDASGAAQREAAQLGERVLGGSSYQTGSAVGSRELYRTVTGLAQELGSAQTALEAGCARVNAV